MLALFAFFFVLVGDYIQSQTKMSDYLIITVDDYADQSHRFSKHKRSQGFIPTIYKVSSKDTITAENLRNKIREYHRNGVRYVLLVGNQEHIPVIGIPGYKDFPGDFYYSLMDDNDKKPDIAVGRIPADNGTEAGQVLDKIIAHQKSQVPGFNRALLVGLCDLPNLNRTEDERLDAAMNGQDHDDKKLSFSYLYPRPDFKRTYNPCMRNSRVIGQFSNGQSLAIFMGHGSKTDFSAQGGTWNGFENSFNLTDIGNMNNNIQPVVFMLACLTGRFDDNDNNKCFAEALLNRQGGGATAVYAATRVSIAQNMDCYASLILKAIYNKGIFRIGDVINYAVKEQLSSSTGCSSTNAEKNASQFLLFGDPSQEVLPVDIYRDAGKGKWTKWENLDPQRVTKAKKSPALCTNPVNNRVEIIYQGIDNSIYYNSIDVDRNWNGEMGLGGTTGLCPAIASNGYITVAAYTGVDRNVYFAFRLTSLGEKWTKWQKINGLTSNDSPGIVMNNTAIHIVAKEPTKKIKHIFRKNIYSPWQPVEQLAGHSDIPIKIKSHQDKLYIVWRKGNNLFYNIRQKDGNWTGAKLIPMEKKSVRIYGEPAFAIEAGEPEVLIRANNNKILHWTKREGWAKIWNGESTGNPALAASRWGHFLAVIRGTDDHVYYSCRKIEFQNGSRITYGWRHWSRHPDFQTNLTPLVYPTSHGPALIMVGLDNVIWHSKHKWD
jgi:hypothetical protein